MESAISESTMTLIWSLASVLLVLALVVFIGLWWQRRQPVMPVGNPAMALLDHQLTLKHDLPQGTGRVHIDGKLWKVRAGGPLVAGSRVRVTDLDGDTLLIQPNQF